MHLFETIDKLAEEFAKATSDLTNDQKEQAKIDFDRKVEEVWKQKAEKTDLSLVKSIKIIAMPLGQAPEWVRQEWIGVTIPLLEKGIRGTQMGLFGGPIENENGYRVSSREAVDRLKNKSVTAAQWFEQYINFVLMPVFVFSKEVCEIVG